MNITEVRIVLARDTRCTSGNLLAFATIAFDDVFVVNNLKIIEGPRGVFVSMPSRKLCDRCKNCGTNNPLRARHCNDCGRRVDLDREPCHPDQRFLADVAHPITGDFRDQLERAVVAAYDREIAHSESSPAWKSHHEKGVVVCKPKRRLSGQFTGILSRDSNSLRSNAS